MQPIMQSAKWNLPFNLLSIMLDTHVKDILSHRVETWEFYQEPFTQNLNGFQQLSSINRREKRKYYG